jgi:hypothetical protein
MNKRATLIDKAFNQISTMFPQTKGDKKLFVRLMSEILEEFVSADYFSDFDPLNESPTDKGDLFITSRVGENEYVTVVPDHMVSGVITEGWVKLDLRVKDPDFSNKTSNLLLGKVLSNLLMKRHDKALAERIWKTMDTSFVEAKIKDHTSFGLIDPEPKLHSFEVLDFQMKGRQVLALIKMDLSIDAELEPDYDEGYSEF